MNKNIKIAKQLIGLAKELVAVPTATFDEFDEFNEKYKKDFGNDADSSIWDLFNTEEQKKNFLETKKQKHPNLSEFLDKSTLKKILDSGYFTICSAGISSAENQELKAKHTDADGDFDKTQYEQEKNGLVKSRLDTLCNFLDGLNVKYSEVLGQFYDEESEEELAELSYLVDLSNVGENDETKAKSLLKQISTFCGNNMNQTAVIEGIRGVHAYVYCGDRSNRISQGEGEMGYGRSTVRHDEQSRSDWSDDYNWDDNGLNKKDWI